jgi:formamidopyrimidine-DNA glycosylase
VRVDLRRQDLRFPFPDRFIARLEGQTVLALSRRAKYILGHLQSGEILILHLGMTGRFTVFKADGGAAYPGAFYSGSDHGSKGPHDHVQFILDDGTRIVYSDPRRFGLMDLALKGEADSHKLLRGLGVEPLGNGFSADYLAEKFRAKAAPLKAALLDQRIIAGLGNIYVCEALHRAKLSPRRKARSLIKKSSRDPRLDNLVRHVRDILDEAIRAGGSTLQDYHGVDGAKGAFQHRFSVYDREGEACACGSPIRRIVQSGRSTFYCAACQT